MPSGDVYSMSVDQTLASQALSNVLHFVQVGSDGTGDARAALYSVFDTSFLDALLGCLVSDVDIVQTRIRRIHPTTTQAKITAVGAPGLLVGNPMPVGSCSIIRFSSESSGRKGTGFSKITGARTIDVRDGRVDVVYAVLLQAYADLFPIDYTDAGTGYVFRACVWSSIDLVARKIDIGNALTRVRTIHSRQIGVGA